MPAYRREPSWDRDEDAPVNYQATNDPLAMIYNEGLWRIFMLSPLHNLQCTPVKLKQYASKVRQTLVRSINTNNNFNYTVQFDEQPLLKYSEDDSNGLMITVSCSQENNSNKKVVYVAVLLSWGMSINLENATHLPYMLERGEQKIGNAVHATLQSAFDCNIKQFTFSQCNLLHLGYMFVENDTSRSNDPFTLVYRAPQAVKNRLSLSVEVGHVRRIWNWVKNDAAKTSELVYIAYQILQNQIFEMVDLDITVFDLCEVNLPKGEIKSSGVVKMKTPEMVNCFFTALNEISDWNTWNDLNNSDQE